MRTRKVEAAILWPRVLKVAFALLLLTLAIVITDVTGRAMMGTNDSEARQQAVWFERIDP